MLFKFSLTIPSKGINDRHTYIPKWIWIVVFLFLMQAVIFIIIFKDLKCVHYNTICYENMKKKKKFKMEIINLLSKKVPTQFKNQNVIKVYATLWHNIQMKRKFNYMKHSFIGRLYLVICRYAVPVEYSKLIRLYSRQKWNFFFMHTLYIIYIYIWPGDYVIDTMNRIHRYFCIIG